MAAKLGISNVLPTGNVSCENCDPSLELQVF